MIRPVRADGRIDAGGVFTPIFRPRVVDRIAAAAQQRVVLIVAPAGYGKSTALKQYLDALREPFVRYDLHADNANLLGFIRGFAEALSEVAPDARATVTSAFESARQSPTPGLDLAIWMHAHIKAHSGLIAIDDLHLAEEEPEVSRFLTSLIERTKGRVRWILASRSSLDLPVGSWLAYQEMDLAVDETDLRFTTEEVRETARVSQVRVRDEELDELLALTEGWPTALSFALRSSTRSLDLRNVQANTRDLIYRYLAEQVFGTLTDRERDFLALAVLMPRIDLRVLQQAGFDDALAIVEALRHRAAFITPDNDDHNIYYCQDLFRDFVRYQIGLEGESAIKAAHARVAQAYEAAEEPALALTHYAESSDTPAIVRILDTSGFALLEQAYADAVAKALDALDPAARATSAMPLALRGLLEAGAGRYDQAESYLKRAADRATDPEQRAQMLLPAARIAANRGNNPLEMLRKVESDEQVSADSRAMATALAVNVALRAGEREGALETIDRVISAAQSTASPPIRIRLLQLAGMAATQYGDQFLARDLLTSVSESASAYGLHSIASKAFAGLATSLGLFEQDAGRHLWYAQQAAVCAAKGGEMFDLQTSTLLLLSAEVRRGNSEQVTHIERQLAQLRTDSSRLIYVANALAQRHGWEGRFDEAYRNMSTAWERLAFVPSRAVAGSLCAIYAAACGRPDVAKTIVAQVGSIVETHLEGQGPALASLADVATLFCALAEAIAGRQTSSLRLLKRDVSSDQPYVAALSRLVAHAVRAIKSKVIDAGTYTADVQAIREAGLGGYALLVETVIGRFAAANAHAPTDVRLTPTEVAILNQLALGLTPKEIAEESGRSVNTVQVHIQNAIEKLGCHGRNEAIVVAKRLGVLAG